MDVKHPFIVTEKARAWVAGQRNPGKDEVMMLTEEQAHYAVQLGELKPKPGKAEKPKGKGGEGGGAPAQ